MSDDIARDVAELSVWASGSNRHGEQAHPFAARVLRVLAFLDDQSRLCVALAERVKAVRAEERERAAKLAEAIGEELDDGLAVNAGHEIAAAIREGKQHGRQ